MSDRQYFIGVFLALITDPFGCFIIVSLSLLIAGMIYDANFSPYTHPGIHQTR